MKTILDESRYLKKTIGIERNLEFLEYADQVNAREMPRLVAEYYPQKTLGEICDIYDNLFPLERLVKEFLDQ